MICITKKLNKRKNYSLDLFKSWCMNIMIIYIYLYIYKRLNEMSKNEIIKFSNFISNIISKLLKNISFLVMIGNIISLVRI